MNRNRRVAAVGATALLGVAVLAGCSSSSTSTPSAAASTSASSGTQMLPPVIITEDQTEATAKVGDFLDIIVTTPAGTTIAVDKPELIEITQAHEDGGAVFNPGGKTLAAGTAIITVTNPNGNTRDITVTITE